MKKSYQEARAEFDARIAARRVEEGLVLIMVPTPPEPVNEGPVQGYRVLKHVGGSSGKPVAFGLAERDANIFIAAAGEKIIRIDGELTAIAYSKVREN